MKFIRFLLSHGILLLFIVALGAGYYYRANIFPEKVNAKIDSSVYRIMVFAKLAPEQQAASVTPTPESDATAMNDATEDNESNQEESSPNDSDQNESAQTDASEQKDTDQNDIKESQKQATERISESTSDIAQANEADDKSESTEIEPQVSLPVEENTEETAVVSSETEKEITSAELQASNSTKMAKVEIKTPSEPTPMQTADNAKESPTGNRETVTDNEDDAAPATDKEAGASAHAKILDQARLAFQKGNSSEAIKLYQQLNELSPDNPNAYGEMGNILYAQGKWQLAGKAYYEAAIRLHSQGKTEQMRYLYRVIRDLDPESAKKLRNQSGR